MYLLLTTHFARKHTCTQMQELQVGKWNCQLLHCYDQNTLAKSLFASSVNPDERRKLKTQGKNKDTEACTSSGLLLSSRGIWFSEVYFQHGTPISHQQEKKRQRKQCATAIKLHTPLSLHSTLSLLTHTPLSLSLPHTKFH